MPSKELPPDPFFVTRRHFFSKSSLGLGSLALAGMGSGAAADETTTGILGAPHYAPKARRVIYLFQSGGPAQQELFDEKPLLRKLHRQPLPDEVRRGQRLTGMSANQGSLLLAGSHYGFNTVGKCGARISELLPHTSTIADEMCIVRTMFTEAINHDPAITFFQTGSQLAGRPCMGSWVNYGLGSVNHNLPGFIVLVTKNGGGQPLYSRLWGNGFLPTEHQGVPFRAGKDAVLYLSNPDGICQSGRRSMLDKMKELNLVQFQRELDPAVESRIAQYEMAFRMQTSVPDATDVSDEPDWVFDLYGKDARTPGTYAANCLLARRLAERGVRFIQLYHQDWDHHGNLVPGIKTQCQKTDQASAALVKDLKQRGLLDDTLVIWGGEFGRTSYSQGDITANNYGRDHHPRCFSLWMAGGGVKGGTTFGQTDPYGYNILDEDGNISEPDSHKHARGGVHVHDLQATILHLLGIDHERLVYRYQGRRFRLTDVHGRVQHQLLA